MLYVKWKQSAINITKGERQMDGERENGKYFNQMMEDFLVPSDLEQLQRTMPHVK